MSESLLQHDAIICHEMMAHTPLFTHRQPHTVAILHDNEQKIVQEVQKHTNVASIWQILAKQETNPASSDSRIKYAYGHHEQALAQIEPLSLDVLIIGAGGSQTEFDTYFSRLQNEGILIQLCDSPFQLSHLKSVRLNLTSSGFQDVVPLHFPQPSFASGWRAAVMAIKAGALKRPREKDIFNKSFSTQYYNLDVHKAAFALPEFMALELGR